MNYLLYADGLTKYFEPQKPFSFRFAGSKNGPNKICALDNISFSVGSGQILACLGANGAGKTTLLRILADILAMDQGNVTLARNINIKNSRLYRANLGYVSSDERSFFWRLTGRQNLRFFGRLYGLFADDLDNKIQRLIASFKCDGYADRLFRDYSAGMRKKMSLIRALLHDPRLLLLDELTNSLDIASIAQVRSFVRSYVLQQNCSAVWSTHRLEELYGLCDSVLALREGSMVFFGSIADFQERSVEYYAD